MNQAILGFTALVSVSLTPISIPVVKTVVVEKSLNLTTRTPSSTINEGFADNMLLSLHYLKGDVDNPKEIDWGKMRQPFETVFTLQSNEVFAFHNNVLPQYNPPTGGPVVTMNSRFVTTEGYKFVAGLGGNGVCHLASLIAWAAAEAKLEVMALARHDFYPVQGVPKNYGTSIMSSSATQNLYIKNIFDVPVTFYFKADKSIIDLKILR